MLNTTLALLNAITLACTFNYVIWGTKDLYSKDQIVISNLVFGSKIGYNVKVHTNLFKCPDP